MRAYVAGHDEDSVLEVDSATVTVSERPSSRICRSMFKTSGCAFSFRPAKQLQMDDVARPRSAGRPHHSQHILRRTDKLRDRVSLHILRHVQPDQSLFTVE